MQRRPVPSSVSSRPPVAAKSRFATAGLSSDAADYDKGDKRKSGNKSTIVLLMIVAVVLFLLVLLIVSVFFPKEFQLAEQGAKGLAKIAYDVERDLAQKAVEMEQESAKRFMGQQQQQQQSDSKPLTDNGSSSGNGERFPPPADMIERIKASHEASARMEGQSSRWVDGEKKLKHKLQELYDRQQNGQDLGAPVLTRWLGDEYPAYVTSDMDVDIEEWKQRVQDKYAEMRKEEEEWQAKMSKIIERRERDIGITTQ